MPNDALSAGLGLAGAVAPSLVSLISLLVDRFSADPKGTEEKVASVYDQVVELLGPASVAEGELTSKREEALSIAIKLLAARLPAPVTPVILPT